MKLILIIGLQFVILSTFCQTKKFNVLYSDSFNIFRNIIVTDSGYFLIGAGANPNSYILTNYVNNDGLVIWQKKIQKANCNLYHGYENCLKNTSSGYILAGNIENSTGVTGLLIKFNSVFDTLWSKQYSLDTNYLGFYDCYIDSDSNIFICGSHEITPLVNNDAIILKMDNNGNLLFYKHFGSTPSDLFSKILKDQSGIFIIAGQSGLGSGDWLVIKTDSASNQLWWNHYGTATENDTYVWGLINTQDSGYILTGIKATNSIYQRGRIMKFKKNMSVEWDKLFLTQSDNAALITTIELEDKNLVTVGAEGYDPDGVIMKLKKNGDTIWKRNYRATNNTAASNVMLTVKETPDKGYIIAGYNHDPQINFNETHAWIVKTNCLGYVDNPVAGFSQNGSVSQHSYFFYNQSQNADSCLWDFGDGSPLLYAAVADTVEHVYSQTGFYTVQLIAYTGCPVQDRDTLQQLILVSIVGYDNINSETGMVTIRPNPAKEKVYISAEHQVKNMQLQVLSQQGTLVFQNTMLEKSIEINTQNWLPGVYVVKLISEKGFVVKKLVIE